MQQIELEPRRVEVPEGGRYSADQNPDGSWNVRNVPVFPGVEAPFDRAWLEHAVIAAQLRYAEGHVAPLHVHHHNFAGASEYETDSVQDAGLFLPTRVGTVRYEGADVPCVFADFLAVPAWTFDRLRFRELKYRSVEILDVRRTEINSCALLSHECPRYRLPMLTIGRTDPFVQEGEEPRALYAQATPEHSAVFIFTAQEEAFVADEKKDDKANKPEGGTVEQLLAKLCDQMTAQNALVAQLVAKKAEEKPADEDDADGEDSKPEKNSDEPPAQPEGEPVEENRKAAREQGAQIIKLAARAKRAEGEAAAARAEAAAAKKFAEEARGAVTKMTVERDRDEQVVRAIARLQAIGAKVDDAYRAELRKFAESGALEVHVKTRETYGASDPKPWNGGRPLAARAEARPEIAAAKKANAGADAQIDELVEKWDALPEVFRAKFGEDARLAQGETPLGVFIATGLTGVKGVARQG